MKRLIVKGITVALLVAALAFPLATPAFASPTTGQPGSSAGVACDFGNASMTPGGSGSSPGAPFNEPIGSSSGGQAGTVYAGNPGTPSLANGSSNAVSQYDVARLMFTNRP